MRVSAHENDELIHDQLQQYGHETLRDKPACDTGRNRYMHVHAYALNADKHGDK